LRDARQPSQNLQAAEEIKEASSGEVHCLRKDIKKVRYSMEFFEAVLPGTDARRAKQQLAKLQGILERLNDIDSAKATALSLRKSVAKSRKTAIKNGSRKIAAHLKAASKSTPSEAVGVGGKLRLKSF